MGMLLAHVTRVHSADSVISIDLDIEGGSTAHFQVFVNRLRTLMNGGNKKCATGLYICIEVQTLTSFLFAGTTSPPHPSAPSLTPGLEGKL